MTELHELLRQMFGAERFDRVIDFLTVVIVGIVLVGAVVYFFRSSLPQIGRRFVLPMMSWLEGDTTRYPRLRSLARIVLFVCFLLVCGVLSQWCFGPADPYDPPMV